jgi:hypothetical protein
MSQATTSLRPAVRATLLDVDPGRFRYSAWNNVSVGVWSDQATLEAAQRVIRVSKWMTQEYPQGHSNIIFVLAGAPAPTPDANEVFSRVYDEKFSHLSCLGIVLEGSGFWASRIRSSITSMRISVPGKVRVRVSDDVDELLEWFLPEHNQGTGVKLSLGELRRALLALREVATNDNGEAPALSTARGHSG